MATGLLGVVIVLVVEPVAMEHKLELVFATILLQGMEEFHVKELELNQEHAGFEVAKVSKKVLQTPMFTNALSLCYNPGYASVREPLCCFLVNKENAGNASGRW